MATTKRGIRYPYGEDYDLDADVPEDLKKMAESTDKAIDDVEKSLEEKLGTYENTYDSTETYLIGSIVVYDKKIYECLEETTGEFDTTKWQEISIKELIDLYKQQTDNNTEAIQELDETKADVSDVEELQNEIEENYKEITKLQEENEDLKKNQLTNTPTPATSHYLQDSADSRFRKFNPIGRTTQESTTGKQLCTRADLQSSENIRFYFNKNLLEKTFTISFIPNETLNNTLYLDKSNGSVAVDSISGSANTRVSKTITLTDEVFESLQSATWFNFRLYKGGASFTIPKELMIQNGSTTTDYEPYTGGEPAPNPNYPIEIKNTGDNVNLFDVESWVTKGNNSNYYSYENGELSINSVDTRTFVNFTEDERIYLPNGEYCLSNIGSASIRIYNNDTEATVENNQFIVTKGYIYLKLVSQTVITCKPKIEQGTKATPYSPYGCGNVNEKVSNKNLIDVPYTKDNPLNVTGQYALINLDTQSVFVKGIVKKGDKIKLSCKAKTDSGTLTNRSQLYLGEGGMTPYLPANTQTLTTEEKTISNYGTMVNDIIDGRLRIVMYSNENITFKAYDFMLEKVESDTEVNYVPHSEQTLSFPLKQGQKFYEGSHPDDDEKVHHKRKQKIFDGSDDENWSLQSINSNGIANFAIGLADYSGRDENLSLCDYFSSQSTPIAQTTNEGYYLTISKTLYIRIKSTTASTVAELRTWLSTHNTTFEYELAEEQKQDFTEEQKTAWKEWEKARTYKNVTHISSEDETPANVEIEYVQDTKTYIDNQIEPLKSAIISLGGNV